MIVLYVIYVFVMFTWINSLKNRLYKIYEEDREEDKIAGMLISSVIMAFLDIIEFAIIIWFLYTVGRVG